MLSILQVPSDDNDTLTTVISRFIAISHHMGQNLTIIIPDQPLYNRGEELMWQITSLKVSSFSWDDSASASTSSKALANTWTMQDFDQAHPVNPDFMLWSTFMIMVEILLDLIRYESGGNWILPLDAFTAMLPWLTKYNNTNYAQVGPVYHVDMNLLERTAAEIHAEFLDGSIVAKRTKKQFNQVSADQSTEWINRTCKMHNGIIVIKRNDQARDKFYVTWSE